MYKPMENYNCSHCNKQIQPVMECKCPERQSNGDWKPMQTEEKSNWEKGFDKEVPGYSMNEYRESGNIIRPIMVQRDDALKFIAQTLEQRTRDTLEIMRLFMIEFSNRPIDKRKNVFDEIVDLQKIIKKKYGIE